MLLKSECIQTQRKAAATSNVGEKPGLRTVSNDKLTLATVCRWLDRLGFKHEARKKGCCVDNHERPETVACRRNFIKRCLKHEKRMFRWVQLPLEEMKEMEENGAIEEGLGHRCQDPKTKVDMVEFHVEEHRSFQDRVDQHMVHQDGDSGPCCLSDVDREALKLDCPTGETSTKKRRKDALEKDLRAKGVSAKGNGDALVKLCQQNDVPCEIAAPKTKEGWVGKPKGMLQMLWERGFFDPSRAADCCTNDGKKDAFGNLMPGTSLRMMMSSLVDFVEEETLLQFHGKTLGVLVDGALTCHPEVAGEGIEHSWGCANGKHRLRLPLSSKRKKENFQKSVSQCLDRNDVLTLERQRMFSKRARQCMLSHHCIEMRKEERKLAATKEINPDVKGVKEEEEKKHEMSACLVEKITKKFKSHRGATNFDSAHTDAIVNDMKSSMRRDNSKQEQQ
jgi:hypothetical protein